MEKAKVLIIDDLPENLFVLEEILKQDDREIISASNGNDALKLARLHDFAIILSDVQMPGMDGFELVSLLRMNKRTKHVPVIFLTAISKEEKYVHQGYSEGAVDYIFKPLDPKIVSSKVDTFITLYRQRKQLELQNQQLEELNIQKNKFLGMAAHDIRNPLSIIEYYSRDLMDKTKDEIDYKELKSNLETIYTSSIFIQNLADELLDFTKIEANDFQPRLRETDITELLDNIVKINQLFANKKNITIKQEIELSGLNMAIDPSKITQVLNNLISNAIKFSNKGTEITLEAFILDHQLIVRVQDQGQGIPTSEIHKLFVPFATLSVKSTAGEKSTGLGLAIVKKIIEGHKGDIYAESKVGEGTCFTFKIPVSHKEVVKPIRINHVEGNTNVMVVEDNLIMQTLMKTVFESEGLNVSIAENGQEALDQLNDANPDIIFTDINMPVMDGYVLGEKLREMGVNIPLIGLTALINREIEELSLKAGILELREKPISKIALGQVLEKYVA